MFSRLKDRMAFRIIASLFALSCMLAFSTPPSRAQEYTAQEIVDSGHRFFGATSGGLASVDREDLRRPTACPTAMCSARKAPARSSAA